MALGKDMNEEKFNDLCFQFGLELDEVTSEYEMYKKERGDGFKESEASGKSKRVVYKIEVPANRYDLLCYEGLISSLKIFRGLEKVPTYSLSGAPNADLAMHVDHSVNPLRPFVVCAILRDVQFTEASYQSFIDLQEKLHQNLCRRRTLVAIGTHDLDTLKGPFTYEAVPPEKIVFVPLNQTAEVDGRGMMDLFSQHQQLKAFLPIISNSPVYPVIRDSRGIVLSVPPIINGDHSKITLRTKNVFIECTATDMTKAGVTLNTVVAMFSRYCANPFTVEPVSVHYSAHHGYSAVAGKEIRTPDIAERTLQVPARQLCSCISSEEPLNVETVLQLLGRMGLSAKLSADKLGTPKLLDDQTIEVQVPITRSDVMHVCDLIEDICIAFGFNNVVPETSRTLGRPKEQPINQLSDLIRTETAMAGFTESLTWGLVSLKENFDMLRQEVPGSGQCGAPVKLSNPKSREFEIVRTSLLPGLLKTLAANKHSAPPMKLFELSDVVHADSKAEGGAKNCRRLAAAYYGLVSGFEIIHGLLDQVLWSLGCSTGCEISNDGRRRPSSYRLVASNSATFLGGRQASIEVNGRVIGTLGVMHPEVLAAYEIPFVVSALELDLEPFLDYLKL